MSGIPDQQEAEQQCRLDEAMKHRDMSFLITSFGITQRWQS